MNDIYKLLENISIENLKEMNKEQLEDLALEIREFLIESVTTTGGHLASNLGAVEITLALHYVFDSPKDKILWDVGHQSYVHKILTGRKDKFNTLRQYGGIAGFPKPIESEHDIFAMGHSSNSISVGLGMARARDMQEQDFDVISVIGDGALSGGMCLEALNDAGEAKNKIIVVLNDNEMSIAKNVGALASFLGKMRTKTSYTTLKQKVKNVLNKVPVVGKPTEIVIDKIKTGVKYLFIPTRLFEEMGFTYIGLLDGHDIDTLIDCLQDAKRSEKSVIIHIKTVKGMGCEVAENYPELFHGVCKNFFDEKEEKDTTANGQIFVDKLIDMAKENHKICAITAAMPHGTHLIDFEKEFPDRFIDVGIAEQHAVTLAAGLAKGGMRPYFAVYSTFLQRGFDQVVNDVCLQNLPVVLMIDRAGLVGADGETHHGSFDISYLRQLPNITIMSPATALELQEMLDISATMETPCAIRYSKTDLPNKQSEPTILNKWKSITDVYDNMIVATGDMVDIGEKVAINLYQDYGKTVGLINACFLKPMDLETINDLLKCKNIFTLEDNTVIGGFGSGLLQTMTELGAKDMPKIHIYGIPDRFITHGEIPELFNEIGIDVDALTQKILVELEKSHGED